MKINLFPKWTFSLGLLVYLTLLINCSQVDKSVKKSSYSLTAKLKYQQALEAFEDNNYISAIKTFNQVKNQFPYSVYAVKAELKIGDCYFKKGDFLLAIDEYQMFTRMHPKHEQIPYALFKISLAYFEQMPADFWVILPPSYERDMAATHNALRSFDFLLEKYPQSKYTKEAKDNRRICRRKLADFEYYVADFYRKKKKYTGALWRLEIIKNQYSDIYPEEKILLELLELQLKREETEAAQKILIQLQKKYSGSDSLKAAQKLLGEKDG